MSWPQWQPPVQPSMPMMNTTMPMGIQYTAEQWQQMQQQNWQQWAQWQQQYQQWQQQYGAEYQKSLTAMAAMGNPAVPVMNTSVPPPLPNDTKPPPPPEEPQITAPIANSNQDVKTTHGYNTQNKGSNGSGNWVTPSNNSQAINSRQLHGKRQALEYSTGGGLSKKNKLDWQAPQAVPTQPANIFGPHLPDEDGKEDLSDPEKKFMKQFAEWEAQFNKWKEQNQDHPDKTQYREYEKKWEAWRNQLLERRDLMRKKRLGLVSSNSNSNSIADTSISPKPTGILSTPDKIMPLSESTDMLNPINSNALATLFKTNANDGIPGLDLVDAPAQPDEIALNEKVDPISTQPNNLNLEDLSKNLNSILGDQKLLSMLSLVAQTTNAAILKTDSNNLNSEIPVKTTPSGITLAPPKGILDDQNSNWSVQTTNSGNSASWCQEQPINRDTITNKDLNAVNDVQSVKTEQFVARETTNYEPNLEKPDDDYWSSNNPQDMQSDIVPAPPSITSEILHIDNITDYEHKPIKQDTTDVRVFTPRLFDYRHKLVTRIPLSERPKWLSDSFRNIPEFNPPISRIPPYARHHSDQYPPVPSTSGNRYNEVSSFSRRNSSFMPDKSNMDYENSGPNKRADVLRRNEQFERFKRPIHGGQDRTGDDKERDRFRDRDKSRDAVKRDLKDATVHTSKHLQSVEPFKSSLKATAFTQSQQLFGAAAKLEESRKNPRTTIDDLLMMPGRVKRPQRFVIILRGPPGSGKTFLAKQIKDKETENGGSAPRILSLDDYFMIEQEREVVEDGKTTQVKEMVYEFEECMETTYRQSLLKTFKKTITDGYFPFIIVDNVNDKLKYFDEMWSFAKQNGFQVYICQLDLDVQMCTKRNTHGRSEVEIQHIVNGWEELPLHYGILDATSLIQASAITEVEMEEINSPNDDFDDDDIEEQTCNSSKWDKFECSIDNLAKLDGINKSLRSARTMEDYLQLDEWTATRAASRPGQKRVRWADLEERKEQEKMRAIGFVVGQTDWGRMMDPTQGSSALTQTKYIERVGIRKVNTN